MDKITLGILFILAGLIYGSLAVDKVYDSTLGYLIANKWINPPAAAKMSQNILGRKPLILVYSFVFILIGIYLLWNHQL